MKGILGKLAALAGLANLNLSTPELRYSVPQTLALPDFARRFAPRRRNRSTTKPSWRELKLRIAINAARMLAAHRKTAALKGDPPGYTYRHRDRLVRMVGARGANRLEEGVLARRISYRRAIEIASQVAA